MKRTIFTIILLLLTIPLYAQTYYMGETPLWIKSFTNEMRAGFILGMISAIEASIEFVIAAASDHEYPLKDIIVIAADDLRLALPDPDTAASRWWEELDLFYSQERHADTTLAVAILYLMLSTYLENSPKYEGRNTP